MGLLAALNLPDRPKGPPPGAPSGASAAAPKTASKTQADVDQAWKDVLAFAGNLKDVPTKLQLAQALKAVDATRQQAAKAGDPQQKDALLRAALADIATAREQAHRRSESAARDAVAAHKAKLEGEFQEHHDGHEKLADSAKRLDGALKVSKDGYREELEQQKAELDKRLALAAHRRDEARTALEALADPTSKSKAHVGTLARVGHKGEVAAHTDVDHHEGEGGLPGSKHVTTTTTSYRDGKGVTDTVEQERKVGVGSATFSTKKGHEEVRADSTVRHEQETSTTIGLKGVSRETREVSELEHADGTSLRVEQGTGTEIGPEGAKRTTTRTVTMGDGSSVSTSKSGAFERGDGKVGASGEVSKTRTDAEGREKSGSVGGKGGLNAKDGVGGYAEGTGSVGTRREGGFNTKASLGLKSNITCDIEGPDAKGMYTVKLDVVLGAALDAGGGRDKKGGSVKASVGAQASQTVTMHQEVHVHERDIQGYVENLKKANTGKKVSDATRVELQIIATGAGQSWEAAKRLYEGSPLAVGGTAGDTETLKSETSKGASASLSVKGVGVSGSHSETHSRSTTATRNEKGGVDAVSTTVDSSKTGKGASLDTGTTSLGVDVTQTFETSIGYLVTIPAGADPGGKLLAAFHACKTPEEQERLIRAHQDRIQLTGTRRGTKKGSEKHDKLGVGGASLDLGSSANLSETVTRDASGKTTQSTIVGESHTEGSLGVSESMRIGDGTKDTATALHDDQGQVELQLDRDKHSTSLLDKVKSLLPFGDDEEAKGPIEPVSEDGPAEEKAKRPKGAIAKVAGHEARDVEVHDVFGMRLGKADLLKIVELANGDAQRWTECAWLFDEKAIKEWSALRGQIATKGKADPAFVADSLARYVGADRGQRMEALVRLVRPGGKIAIGHRAEFPPSLKDYTKIYAELVEKPIEERIAEKRKKDGAEAAGKLGERWFTQLGQILSAVQGAGDFSSKSAQMEMMSAINDRKQALLEAMRAAAGGDDAAAKSNALRHDYTRVRDQLQRYPKLMDPDLATLAKKLGNRDYFIGASDLIDQLQEMADRYALWSNDYEKAVALAKRAGIAEADVLPFKPDLTAFRKYRRAAGLSD